MPAPRSIEDHFQPKTCGRRFQAHIDHAASAIAARVDQQRSHGLRQEMFVGKQIATSTDVDIKAPSRHRHRDLGRDLFVRPAASTDCGRNGSAPERVLAASRRSSMRRPSRLACDRTRPSARARTSALSGREEREPVKPRIDVIGVFSSCATMARKRSRSRSWASNGAEHRVEGVGQDGDFVAPLFEHALVDAELMNRWTCCTSL